MAPPTPSPLQQIGEKVNNSLVRKYLLIWTFCRQWGCTKVVCRLPFEINLSLIVGCSWIITWEWVIEGPRARWGLKNEVFCVFWLSCWTVERGCCFTELQEEKCLEKCIATLLVNQNIKKHWNWLLVIYFSRHSWSGVGASQARTWGRS